MIQNKVKDVPSITVEQFLGMEFNTLKQAEGRDVTNLRKSIIKNHFIFPVYVWKNYCIDGAGRKIVVEELLKEGHNFENIPIVPIEAINLDEAKQRVLEYNSRHGDYDDKSLKDFLASIAEPDYETIRYDELDINGIVDDFEMPDETKSYTNKIQVPAYEPKREKAPEFSEMVDEEKTRGLIEEIDRTGMPEEVKQFLRLGAYRHLKFNYKNIAEYYAHADKDVQELMEKSALIIIDFNKALENGYVTFLSEVFNEQEDEE